MNTNHSNPSLLALTGVLLRQPERLVADDERDTQAELLALAPKLLALTLIGGAAFGVVVGSYRGSIQYLYAGLKAPLLLLLPILLGLPALRAFLAACELRLSWSRLALASLLAVARTAVLAAATSPVLWLYLSMNPDYHRAVLAMAGALVLVGAPGLWTLTSSLPSGGRHRALAHAAALAVFGVLLAQTGWLLRPFVVRPRAEIALLRPIEADVFSSLQATRRSAQGRDVDWDARGGGLLGADPEGY
ncbi:hypothetical protein ACNOYE_32600 [Nannocystaceae bacterium ST9]